MTRKLQTFMSFLLLPSRGERENLFFTDRIRLDIRIKVLRLRTAAADKEIACSAGDMHIQDASIRKLPAAP
ncbi:MAG: hypothetical protein BWK80_50785 [Desulfobacteraceae bacterium IS3]|nr:MAG: hypothetical protein BWK80_50785 [Desulfobacteraceae bacterium IS3]